MTSKETWGLLNVYKGILFNHSQFKSESDVRPDYTFDSPEFEKLKGQYNLPGVAGEGSDFERAKRLMHHFAPRLTHCPWYDNHIDCNALALLAYSLDNPAQGINCLNKAKILSECCLAVGIYARRVRLMPFSPYDFDNHVITEIYDRNLRKWVVLDPSTDGYFVGEEKAPLSLLEMRNKFANNEPITFVSSSDKLQNLSGLQKKHLQTNLYICKNLFYFQIEQHSGFGQTGDFLYFVPQGYSVKDATQANLRYRLENLPAGQEALRPMLEERAFNAAQAPEPLGVRAQALWNFSF